MPQTNLTGTASIPDNSISESKLAFTIDKFPTGTVTMHAGSVAPAGWLICNGEQLPNGVGTVQGKQADFSALYTALGTAYGAQGILPDCRGIFVRGAGSQTIGSKTYSTSRGTKSADKTLRHTHGVTGSVTTTATSTLVQSSLGSFPAIKFVTGTNVSDALTWASGVSTSKDSFVKYGSSSISKTEVPTVNTSASSVHNLATAFQTNGDTNETAPASIGLNYIIKI